jgi:glycerophosphoryl diester phosphodiesterase
MLGLAVAAVAAVALFNGSWRAAPLADAGPRLLSHRGVHQTFSREGLDNDTCTAQRIGPPEHAYLENTVASMRAAFAAGADVVELDVHPTTDGHFAVMHDWSLECRTNGTGTTRSRDLAYLKSLDIGYGYTPDGGRSFPLRGRAVGAMPELAEVLAAFPERRFLVNFKSREAREGDLLAELVQRNPAWRSAVWGVYGGDEPTFRAAQRIGPPLKAWSRRSLVGCLGRYIAFGWTGIVPDTCRDTAVMVPINVAPWLWGWPHLMQQRLREAGTNIVLVGPFRGGDPGTSGIDTLEQLAQVPAGFSGYLWTNKIEHIGPAVAAAKAAARRPR